MLVCIYLACSVMAADYQNSLSVPSNIKTCRLSDGSISTMGNFCRLFKLLHLSVKLEKIEACVGSPTQFCRLYQLAAAVHCPAQDGRIKAALQIACRQGIKILPGGITGQISRRHHIDHGGDGPVFRLKFHHPFSVANGPAGILVQRFLMLVGNFPKQNRDGAAGLGFNGRLSPFRIAAEYQLMIFQLRFP